MVNPVQMAEVILWDHTVAYVAWDSQRSVARFEYAPDFLRSQIEIAPLTMPLGSKIFSFPSLSTSTFRGLPGLLADSLPDRFGNALIDQWLASQGRDRNSFSPLERLCYLGTRGMGALEFRPVIRQGGVGRTISLQIEALVELADAVLSERESLNETLSGDLEYQRKAMEQLLLVGTSAGGARAKAVIAWNEQTGSVRSGQGKVPAGYSHWLLKFDGVQNRDKETHDPQGFGHLEYAYHLMARAAGIEMEDCRLLEENGRAHFMTRRFDRTATGDKLHMQSLCAMGHFDFNMAGAHSYEQALQIMVQLGLPATQQAELFRRMVFNVMARNQDDHTRNIAFLMDKKGQWKLSPAFDLTYAYNPQGMWTSKHQMAIQGKTSQVSYEDFKAVAKIFAIPKFKQIIEQVQDAISQWAAFSQNAGVGEKLHKLVQQNLRTDFHS